MNIPIRSSANSTWASVAYGRLVIFVMCLYAPITLAAVDVNRVVTVTAPSIVQVQGIQWIKVKIPDQYKNVTDDPVYQSLSSIFIDNADPKAAPVVKKRISGTGFIISPNGRIATNYQWIKGAHEIVVILSDRRQMKAQVVRTEPKNDLAIIKINGSALPALSLATEVEEGEGVIAIGFDKKGASVGVVVSTPAQTPAIGLISDVMVSRDNSGGPLLNTDGLVLGINSTQTKAPLGLYRHPSLTKLNSGDSQNDAGPSINLLSQVGFAAKTVSAEQKAQLGMNNAAGALVVQVRAGSIASNAGLMNNDVIIGLESQRIIEASDLNALVDFLRQDQQAKLRVLRAGETINLTLKSLKTQASTPANAAWQVLGLRTRVLSTAQKDAFGFESGLMITEVGGRAAEARLLPGDWIISVNNAPLKTPTQLSSIAQKLESDDSVVLYVVRGQQRHFMTLTVDGSNNGEKEGEDD